MAYYAKLGVRVECVMTDNGSCYCSKMFRAACKRLGLRQIYTRPYTPKTNGKAERFIQTALREWAYAQAYQSSGETLELVDRQAEGDASKLPRLAAEIVAARPDVIACSGTTETSALRAATAECSARATVTWKNLRADESVARPVAAVVQCRSLRRRLAHPGCDVSLKRRAWAVTSARVTSCLFGKMDLADTR